MSDVISDVFYLDRHGWLAHSTNSKHQNIASPNCSERQETPTLLVIHNISLPPFKYGGPYITQLFTNKLNPAHHPYFASIAHLRVSAHFLIRRDGQIIQFVSTDKKAWHAGVSSFQGRKQCNDFSIGIEMEGCDFEPFTPEQYQQLAKLTQLLRQKYPIRFIQGHEHIAQGRKTDPGPFFDWTKFKQLSAIHHRAFHGI